MGRTKLYPMVQFKKNTWEIDEFDVASMFLLVGTEKAMLIDTGIGIGDLRGAVAQITDKPLIVVITHGHIDHIGNARQFDEIYLNLKDSCNFPHDIQRRREDARAIHIRQTDSIGSGMYTAYPLSAYDPEKDIIEPDDPMPVVHDLVDGMEFDLGGGRIVKAYEAPGHTKGHMMLLDSYSRSLFCGDALNYNLGIGAVSAEETMKYLQKMVELQGQYDGIYNGHHDFRALGAPLKEDCLKTTIALVQQLIDGRYRPVVVPSFWGPASGRHPRIMLCMGRNYLGYRGLENVQPEDKKGEKNADETLSYGSISQGYMGNRRI